MAHLVLAKVLITLFVGVHPPDYSERDLCDLWAGAQCQATSCKPDAKERCTQASAPCKRSTHNVVPQDHAEKVVKCARAMLQNACGAPAPAECEGVSGP